MTFPDPSRVDALVEGRSVVVDIQHADGHVNWLVHNFPFVQRLDLDTVAPERSSTDGCGSVLATDGQSGGHVTINT